MPNTRIFIVEDEGIVAADIEDHLKRLEFDVAGNAASGEDAVSRVAEARPDLVLMDIVLRGEMDGLEAARQIREQFDIPVVFLTSHADPSTFRWASRTEPFGYVLKPFDERELRITIEMALYRHRAEQRLRQMERWLATTLNSIGDGVIATDIQGRLTFMNPVAQQLTGWPLVDALGRDCMEVFQAIEAGTGQPVPNPVLRAIEEGVVIQLEPHTLLRGRGGRVLPIDDTAAPIRDDDGNVTGAVLAFRDRTERLRAEEEVRQLNEQLEQRVRLRTAELDAVNQELESFSYSVAHDLRAPLRVIQGFADLLAERQAQTADTEGQRMVSIVSESARRMGQMVDEFLNLAMLSRQAPNLRTVRMTELVHAVLEELQVATRQPAAEVKVGELPVAVGDEGLLRQVWMNLLSNAVKFTGKTAVPRIEVSGRLEGEEVSYCVRDNGAGFDMRYAQRLFSAFYRMHPPAEFEGTGVGLSIVSRIVRRHGGRVWAEAEVGRGASFYFALPADSRRP
jgi:PAS domain S-box-containing protein